MDQTSRAVALRSADAELIEEVRGVLALADLPVLIHPPGAAPPRAALLLDSAAELQPEDEPWVVPGRRAVWVGLSAITMPDGGRPLALPAQAEELLTRARSACQPRRATVVGVVGARGGVGASCLAAVLARACANEQLAVALVDLDGAGPGVDLTLGIEHDGGLRWADLDGSDGTLPGRALEEALPVWHGVHVLSADWRGGPAQSLALSAVDALAAGHDVVVLDLPRAQSQWALHCAVMWSPPRRYALPAAPGKGWTPGWWCAGRRPEASPRQRSRTRPGSLLPWRCGPNEDCGPGWNVGSRRGTTAAGR